MSPLSCKRIDGKLLIIAGYGGADVNPAWVHNLRADPRARVELAGESFDVTARELPPDERQDIIPKVIALGLRLRGVSGEYQSSDPDLRTQRV